MNDLTPAERLYAITGPDEMMRRRRLNFGDDVLKRADELQIHDQFIDTEPRWADHPGAIIIRRVTAVALHGDDVTVWCHDGDEFTTSEGNTFLVLPRTQQNVGDSTRPIS